MAHERGDVGLEPLARAQPGEDVARELRARAVVTEEGRRAVVAVAEGRGLRGIVQQRAEAQGEAAVEVVGERLGEQPAHRVRVLGAEHGRGVRLDGERLLEHLDRVVVDVGVVVAVLRDALQRRELGEDRRGEAEPVHPPQRAQDAAIREDPLELGEHALLRDLGDARGLVASEVARRRLGLELELGGQAHEPQRAQRVVGERARRDGAQAACREVGGAAVGVDAVAAVQGLRHGVDGEVAQREVGVQRAAAQRAEVGVPRAVARHDAPRSEGVGELERRPARGARQALRGGPDVAFDDEVEVRGRALEQAVAHGAPDEPGVEPRERLARRRDGIAHGSPPAGSPSRWYSRGTRGSRPHVTS